MPDAPHHDAVVGEMDKSTMTGAAHPTEGARNQGWWPRQLNLKILAKTIPAVLSGHGAQ